MQDDYTIVPIKSAPGVKRDGTMLEGDAYVASQWCRFERNLPRKIAGYRSINKYLSEVSRALMAYTQDSLTYVHSGSANLVERFTIDGLFNTSIITDRTPASGFTADDRNLWQFDVAAELVGGASNNLIVAQVAPNLECICNNEGGELFHGDLLATTPLTPITLPAGASATGGVVSLHPYLFYFGNDGIIGWSVAGDPTDLSGSGSGFVSTAGQKIVRGVALRGGPGNSPSGLFWAADALIRASFVGGSAVFQFDTLSTQSSIMSPRSVIEYDGVFYWIGSDRFLMYNGVVREVENNLNRDWFFNNMNFSRRQTVFAFKVPRFGEIWWCFPLGDSTEPNYAIIYNVRLNIWYDTELPNGGRSAGTSPTVFRKPLLTGSSPTVAMLETRVTEDGDTRITEEGENRATEESEAVTYKLWIHEVGTDEIDGQNMQPIRSYFETADISFPLQNPPIDRAAQVLLIEPDFVQSGDMTVQLLGRRNARAPEVTGEAMTFPDSATTPTQEVVFHKDQRRQLRFRFESNTIGGDYQMGYPVAHIRAGDGSTLA